MYRLRFTICIVFVNYCYITPSVVNGRILYQYVLCVREHMDLYVVAISTLNTRVLGIVRSTYIPRFKLILMDIYIEAARFVSNICLQAK